MFLLLPWNDVLLLIIINNKGVLWEKIIIPDNQLTYAFQGLPQERLIEHPRYNINFFLPRVVVGTSACCSSVPPCKPRICPIMTSICLLLEGLHNLSSIAFAPSHPSQLRPLGRINQCNVFGFAPGSRHSFLPTTIPANGYPPQHNCNSMQWPSIVKYRRVISISALKSLEARTSQC